MVEMRHRGKPSMVCERCGSPLHFNGRMRRWKLVPDIAMIVMEPRVVDGERLLVQKPHQVPAQHMTSARTWLRRRHPGRSRYSLKSEQDMAALAAKQQKPMVMLEWRHRCRNGDGLLHRAIFPPRDGPCA